MSFARLYINGKFTAQNVTGVQRAAHEWVAGLDRQLGQGMPGSRDVVLLHPPCGQVPGLTQIKTRRCGSPRLSLQAWEQLALPWAARDGLLLNLSGSAAWLAARRSACVLHDAAVFDHGATYTPVFRTWYRSLFRRLGQVAPVLLTVSEFSRERLGATLGLPAERVRVVHHGADHFDRVSAEPGALAAYGLTPLSYLLVVGTHKATKNIDAVIAAWRRLTREPHQCLVWVGGENPTVFRAGGPGRDQGGTAWPDGVLRVGVVSDARLKALYEGAAGLVFASHYEGFGLPPVEAMACGCPVAAASAASLPEVCGDAAIYFDPDRIDQMSATMQALLADADLRDRLRARGRARVATLRWDHSARQLLAALGPAWPASGVP